MPGETLTEMQKMGWNPPTPETQTPTPDTFEGLFAALDLGEIGDGSGEPGLDLDAFDAEVAELAARFKKQQADLEAPARDTKDKRPKQQEPSELMSKLGSAVFGGLFDQARNGHGSGRAA